MRSARGQTRHDYEILLDEISERRGGVTDALYRFRHWLIVLFLVFIVLVTPNPVVPRWAFVLFVFWMIAVVLIFDYAEKHYPRFGTHKRRVVRFQVYIAFGGALYFLGGGRDIYLVFFLAYLVFAPVYVGSLWSAIGTAECAAIAVVVPWALYTTGSVKMDMDPTQTVVRAAVIVLVGLLSIYQWQRQVSYRIGVASQEEQLQTAAAELMTTKDFKRVLSMPFDVMRSHFRFSTALIVADLSNSGIYRPIASHGFAEHPSFEFRAKEFGEGFTGYVLAKRKPLRVSLEYQEDGVPKPKYAQILPDKEVRSYLGVPLHLGARTLGAMMVISSRMNAFGADDEYNMVRIGRWLSVALSNADAHHRLRSETNLLRSQSDLAKEGIIAANSKGVVTHCNSAAQELLGYSRDQLLGMSVSELYWDGLTEAKRIRDLLLLSSGRRDDIDSELRTASGDRLSIALTAGHLNLQEQGWIGTVGYFRDTCREPLTEKRRKALLEVSRLPLRHPEISVGDLAPGIVQALRSAAPSILCGVLHVRERDRLKPIASFGEVPAPLLEESLRRGQGVPGLAWKDSIELVSSDILSDRRFKEVDFGSWSETTSLVCLPLKAGDLLLGVLSLFSEPGRQFPRAELRFYSEFADQAALTLASGSAVKALLYEEQTRTILVIARSLAHQMRSPVTLIKGWIQVLMERPDLPIRTQALVVCESAATRLEGIIAQQLLYARALHLVPERTALYDLVDHVKDLPEIAYQLDEREIEVTVHGDRVSLMLDANLFAIALANLYQNSIDAQPDGGGISVEISRIASGGTRIEVSDRGTGIMGKDFADPQEVFEPFTTVKTVTGSSGLGLGLALTRRIIVAHGGEVIAGNLSDRGGAVFTIKLPPELEFQSEHEGST